MSDLSEDFQRLYCGAALFEAFSALHPINLTRVLPFQAEDPIMDNRALLAAETRHLSNPDEVTRLAVAQAFGQSSLLSASEVASLELVIDPFETDFFEFMGEVYSNAGMFVCALRWYRESIVDLETHRPNMASDSESVYARVGYCLYSLGLYPEAIAWSKSCIGPLQTADTVTRALIHYEARLHGGCVQAIERMSSRTRYTVSTFDPAQTIQLTPRLKLAIATLAPFHEVYIDWINADAHAPEIQPGDYPFQAERDGGTLTRHRMNLIFALCAQADALTDRGYAAEAKRLLFEAALLEPEAGFVRDRLQGLP
jgi:tetratricopeptide (TPR) repeat protein